MEAINKLYYHQKDYLNSTGILDYILEHYGVLDEVDLRIKYNDIVCTLLSGIKEGYGEKVKTAFGDYYVNLHNIFSNDIQQFAFLVDHIINNIGSDFNEKTNIIDVLSSTDVGLVVLQNVPYDEDADVSISKYGTFHNILYFNIDRDIAQWIFDRKPDRFLLSLACGYDKYGKIESGLCVKFMRKYFESFKDFDTIKDFLGLDAKSIKDAVFDMIKFYKDKNGYFFKVDKDYEYEDLYKKLHCDFMSNNAVLYLMSTMVDHYGLCDSEVKQRLIENKLSVIHIRSDIHDIARNVRSGMNIEYDHEFLDDNDINKAKQVLMEVDEQLKRNSIKDVVLGTDNLCGLLNINKESLTGKLLADVDIISATVVCIAERLRYKQGYFYYTYENLKQLNNNECSTKEFLRCMIEKYGQ